MVIFLSAGSEKSMNHVSWDLRTKKSQGFEDLGDEFARLICSPKYQLSTISVPGLGAALTDTSPLEKLVLWWGKGDSQHRGI